MNHTKIKCRACNGTGKAKIGKALQDVLTYFEHNGPSTVVDVFASASNGGIGLTAIYRRIERLIALNLIRKVRNSEPMKFEVV